MCGARRPMVLRPPGVCAGIPLGIAGATTGSGVCGERESPRPQIAGVDDRRSNAGLRCPPQPGLFSALNRARPYSSGMHASAAQHDGSAPKRVFRRRHRLPGNAYAPVFDAKLRKSRGPITLHLRPNGLDEHRLGLSIGRRFGGAVRRNQFKRRVREVFRAHRDQLPIPSGGGAYDIVVTARSHREVALSEYAAWFLEAARAAHRVHERRDARSGAEDA